MLNIKNWFLVIVSFSMFSCTWSKDSAKNEDKKQDRSIASYRKGKSARRANLKKVNIQRKGFYIKHKSLMPLTRAERAGYYRIFINASTQYERLIKKSNYSFNENPFESFKEWVLPKADAAPCPSAFWVLDNGQNDCTRANSFYRPEESPQWDNYGPVGGLAGGVERCASRGNRIACPPLGLEISGGQAMLRCTSNSRGFSRDCDNDQAFANTARLLDECERGGSRSVTNVTCEDLETSVRRAVQMFNDNCSRVPEGTDSQWRTTFRNICGNVEEAVDQVAQRVGERVNPTTAENLPMDHPSCRALGGDVQAERRGEGASSPHWRALLEMTATTCRNARGLDTAELENRFGVCTQAMAGNVDPAEIRRLADNFESSRTNSTYFMDFMNVFGMSPSRYEAAFCDNTRFANFKDHLNENLENDVYHSEGLLIRNLTTSDMEEGLNANRWNAYRGWFAQNKSVLDSLTSDETILQNRINAARNREPSMREHINAAVRLVNEGAAVVDSGAGVEVNYANAINARLNQMGYNNPDELMNIRAAIQAVLTNRILGSDNLQKLGNAQNFMEACRDEISRRRSPRQAEVDGQQGTFTPERGPDCGYRRVSDLSGYFETSESERPYVIFNEDDGICYQQDGDIMTETRQVNNNRTEVRTMHVRNPVPPNNGFRNVALNNTTFDIGNEATSRNDFVLFEFVCDGDDDPYDFGTEREGRSAY